MEGNKPVSLPDGHVASRRSGVTVRRLVPQGGSYPFAIPTTDKRLSDGRRLAKSTINGRSNHRSKEHDQIPHRQRREPHVCRAQEGNCPLGGEHYGSFRECERASEKSFQHTMGRITSRKKKKEILRNLPNDDYVRVFRDYALQYQRNGQGRERPFIVKKDGVVYAITKIDRDGKEQYAMSLNPEFMQEGKSFGMVPFGGVL